MRCDSGDYEDVGDESDERDAIPTASWWRQAATELEKFHLWISDVAGYHGKDGDKADAVEEEEALRGDDGSKQKVETSKHSRTSNADGYADENCDDAVEQEEPSQAEDGSTQNVEEWGHSTWKCQEWTVYFRAVKYDNGESNAMASDVFELKTALQ